MGCKRWPSTETTANQQKTAEDPPRPLREPATPSGSWQRSPTGWYRRPGTSITGPKGPAGTTAKPADTRNPGEQVNAQALGRHHQRAGSVDAELAETGRAIKTAATAAKANSSNCWLGPINRSTQARQSAAQKGWSPHPPAKRHDTRCRNAGTRFVTRATAQQSATGAQPRASAGTSH